MSPYKPARSKKPRAPTLQELSISSLEKARILIKTAREAVTGEDIEQIEKTKIIIEKQKSSPQKSPKKVAKRLNGHTNSNQKINTMNKRNTNFQK